jgi:hypothetical protein
LGELRELIQPCQQPLISKLLFLQLSSPVCIYSLMLFIYKPQQEVLSLKHNIINC